MEAVILKLKESIIYLSTCLNEERLQNQMSRNLSEEKLEKEIFKLNTKHVDELADRVVRNNKEKKKMEQTHQKLFIQMKEDSEVSMRKLQSDHSLLQASFKNYRFEVRDEMNTVIMFKMKDFLKKQSDVIRGELGKKETQMEVDFQRRIEHVMTQVVTRLNYMMDDNRKELHLMRLEYEDDRLSFQLKDILPVDEYSALTYGETSEDTNDTDDDSDNECTKCKAYQAQIQSLQEQLQNRAQQGQDQRGGKVSIRTCHPEDDTISSAAEYSSRCEDVFTSTADLDQYISIQCVDPERVADEIQQYHDQIQELQNECKMFKAQAARYYDELQRDHLYREKAEKENMKLKTEMTKKIASLERELYQQQQLCGEEENTVGSNKKKLSKKEGNEDDLRKHPSCISEDDVEKAVKQALKLPAIIMGMDIKPFQTRIPQVPHKPTAQTPPKRKARHRIVELEVDESDFDRYFVENTSATTILATSGSTIFGTNIYLAPSQSNLSTGGVLTGRLDRNIKLNNDVNQLRMSLVNLPTDLQEPSQAYRARFFPQRESSRNVRRQRIHQPIPRTSSAPTQNSTQRAAAAAVKRHVLEMIVSNTMQCVDSSNELNVGES